MKLTALNPVRHNGKRIAPGEDFEADKKAAALLIANGDAVEAGKAKAEPTEPVNPEGGAQ